MKKLFADTGYWIAILNPRDDLHPKAIATMSQGENVRIFTTDAVLVEVLNAFCEQGPILRAAAAQAVRQILEDPNVTVVPATRTQFLSGREDFEKFKDKDWSHTDCVSFMVMRQNDIHEALAHDHHFQQAGFTILI